MQAYCDEHGVALRPHIKTHKLPELARLQLEAGAVGITCQKLGEAEVMADAGIEDILLSFPLVGEAKAERLAALAERVKMTVVGDSAAVAEGLSPVLARHGLEVDFLVECDTGLGRTGRPEPRGGGRAGRARRRARGTALRRADDVSVAARDGAVAQGRPRGRRGAGLSGRPGQRRRHADGRAHARARRRRRAPRRHLHLRRPRLHRNGSVPLEDCALRIVATVVSRPTRERAIIDAGSKTLTSDLAIGATGHGLLVEYPEAEIYALNEEHGYVDVSRCEPPPEIGDRVTIVPNHACTTANMHDEIVMHRGGEVVETLPTAARGKVR